MENPSVPQYHWPVCVSHARNAFVDAAHCPAGIAQSDFGMHVALQSFCAFAQYAVHSADPPTSVGGGPASGFGGGAESVPGPVSATLASSGVGGRDASWPGVPESPPGPGPASSSKIGEGLVVETLHAAAANKASAHTSAPFGIEVMINLSLSNAPRQKHVHPVGAVRARGL
jgi:hypothetical protein